VGTPARGGVCPSVYVSRAIILAVAQNRARGRAPPRGRARAARDTSDEPTRAPHT